jgi:hypothetical protein
MECRYCNTFRESTIRVGDKKFCLLKKTKDKMASKTDKACNEFTMSEIFWCKMEGMQQSLAACAHREEKPELWPDCVKCRQKRDIKEAKRFAGMLARRKNNYVEDPKPSKKIIKRRAA